MRYIVFLILYLVFGNAYGNTCQDLGGSQDGVPDEYHQHKCMADTFFAKGELLSAIEHYKQAAALLFHESPNYHLRLELGYSQCLVGDVDAGLENISSFILMAKADLGLFDCPDDKETLNEVIKKEHMRLACEGNFSALTKHGRVFVESRLILAKTLGELCDKQ